MERENFSFFPSSPITVGHLTKLLSTAYKTDKKRWHFTQCIIDLWNSLPQDVFFPTSVDGFKTGLGHFMKGKSISVY